MRIMRGIVREYNVYRWAGRMMLDAAVMRERSPFGATRQTEHSL
jgi:trehalose 6-phosphate synthase